MLSDSTGYGTSTGSSSICSSCAVVPASSNKSALIYNLQTNLHRNYSIKPQIKTFDAINLIPNECDYLEDEYLTKSKQINRISTDSNFSDFYSDCDDIDDIDNENAVHFRQHFDGGFSRESNQSRFYGADVFDENQYDQCPIEFESCLQSLFSSRRNTVPFASPVTFLDENGELLNHPDSESSLKSSAPIMRSKINSVIDQHERPSCTPFVNVTDYNLEENRRSLLQDSSEYHRGNSIRLRTMPMPIRANIITTKAFVHNNIANNGIDSTERFVQNIQIGTPMGTITRNSENNDATVANSINIKNHEAIDMTTLSQISEDKEINSFSEEEEEEEDFYTITLPENIPKSLSKNIAKPPPKPPRGRYVAKPFTCIESLANNKKEVKQGPVKRLSINTASFETFFFNKNDKININGISKASNVPKKSILKNGFKSRTPPQDPNEALFGPVEHIYETIDSDPSTISSDDDRSSVPESHPRPVSFASSTTNTVISEHKSKRIMPDLRPALPARPFCWPFTLFPPDMTFCPRSLHAYHRRGSLEAGQIPYYEENIINSSNNFPLDMEPSFKESIKFGSVAKKIARMPSILSKVI